MKDKLYEIMDWAKIESIVYSEEDKPHDFLGASVTDQGVLIQAFIPTARSIEVVYGDQTKKMTQEDENGFFAVLLPGKKVPAYRLKVTFSSGETGMFDDAYNYESLIPKKELDRFNAGICYDIYKYLGAHPMKLRDTEGVHFAVWAPNAVRVSVVGDFNNWDGRRLPMRRLEEYGIFELFVPQLHVGDLYKFEIKLKGGMTYTKSDPYANACELRPGTACVVTDLSDFTWTDENWMQTRAQFAFKNVPFNVTEISLSNFKKPKDGRDYYNYRELAPMVADYVVSMGYTHVELTPVMEHRDDETEGYQTGAFYAPSSRFGSPQDLMYFVDYLHSKSIGVIFDWAPAHFSCGNDGLANYDGTCLYEHLDPRQGVSPRWNTHIFNYGRPQVKNFLIGNALFWAKLYHADGIRVDSVASMLYLDYDRQGGNWVANMYGSNENLEAIEFIKHLNSIFHKQIEGGILIAEEDGAWPRVTGPLDEEGLGFDMKWNEGWSSDFLEYMQLDPIFRGRNHGNLTFSMDYHYCENYMLALSHRECSALTGSMVNRMPGRREMKMANLRAAYGFMMTHPGKKMLCASQDFAQKHPWNVNIELDWHLLEDERCAQLQQYVKDLNTLYKTNPALYELDYDPAGFEWINSISANENIVVFLRKALREEETLLVVCNFSALVYDNHKIGVPFSGKFKEIFNSDKAVYGGSDHVNPRVISSRKDECDAREDSIRITVPPMGVSIFSCQRVDTPISQNEKARSNQRSKVAGKLAAANENVKAESAKKTEKKSLREELARKVHEEEGRS